MFWPWCKRLAYNLTNFYSLLIIFLNFFHNTSNKAWTTKSFNCKPPTMCVHTYHWPYGYPFLMLRPCQWAPRDPWCSLRHFCHCCMKCWRPQVTRITTCTSFTHVQFFSSTNQPCVHQKQNSHPSWCCCSQHNACGFISLILHNLRICSLWCNPSQRKELL
jgi:hypothetical protein